jgi:hypothetical protein
MSKTYRRKGFHSWFTNYPSQVDDFWKSYYYKRPEMSDKEFLALQESEYHRDNHSGVYTFRNNLNKKTSKKNRLRLIQCLTTGDDFEPIPFKRDPGYQYS